MAGYSNQLQAGDELPGQKQSGLVLSEDENDERSDDTEEETVSVKKRGRGRPLRNFLTLSEEGKRKRINRGCKAKKRKPFVRPLRRMNANSNNDFELNDNDFELNDNDFELNENDLELNNNDFELNPLVLQHSKPQTNRDLDLLSFVANEDEKVTDHIKKALNEIVTKFSVGREPVNCILKLLQPFFPKLPVDARTLRSTPKCVIKRVVEPGQYVHIGIKSNLLVLLSQIKDHPLEVVMDVFADGVAFYKISKNKSFWVILGRFDKAFKSVFCIGVYNGVCQPASFNDLLADFIDEAKDLSLNGLEVRSATGSKTYYLRLRNFIGDSIAQADLAYIKHPTGEFSCPYCTIKGHYHMNRMTFAGAQWRLRTDRDFREQIDKKHHTGTSRLFTELMQFPSSSPIDYLHNVLIGACKRFFIFIFGKSGGRSKGLFTNAQLIPFKNHIEQINSNLPTEIHHECRNVKDLGTYKGTDYRVMLLKIGPAFLKNLPSGEIYNAFLLLFTAITLLCDPDECIVNNDLARELLLKFTEETEEIFGTHFVVSVIHRLNHLPDIVMQQGKPLDLFSSFPFESYIATIKKDIHSPNHAIQQIFNRRNECFNAKSNYFSNSCDTSNEIKLGKASKDNPNNFVSISFNGFLIKPLSLRDGFLLTLQKKIVFCQSISRNLNRVIITCKELTHLPSLFTLPIEATKLNHFYCKNDFDRPTDLKDIELSGFERKMFYIPFDQGSCAFSPFRKFNVNHH